jgi:RNA polymerase sigma factor (sigma-70 family)
MRFETVAVSGRASDMASGQLGQVWQRLRGLVGKAPEPPADAQLLERFTASQDMAAFEALVERYGPLVLGVCRRVLGNTHDAEDAFQATFLVFARRAGSIHSQGAVGSWLCGTAYRISLKAKTAIARRRDQERHAGNTMLKLNEKDEAAWKELKPVLDEELNRLPEKYRIPLVLCYLEGKSNEAAARELGWAPGSMSYRLAQARERLRERLVHRGVALTSALMGPALAAYAAAEVPAQLMAPTVKGALLFAAGKAVADLIPAQAVALADAVLQAAAMLKAVLAAVLGLCLLVALGGVGWLVFHGGAGSDPTDSGWAMDGSGSSVKATDPDPRIGIAFTDSQRFGISCLKLRDPIIAEKPKLLTRHERGNTSNVAVRIDGNEFIFGKVAGGAHWTKIKDKVYKELKVGERKWVSAMDYPDFKVRIVQAVEIVVGEQTRLYDTALVKYRIDNLDSKPHTVGLRAMVDTFIGGNDGVPFLIPPTDTKPAYLVDTLEVFEKGRVPEFVRALETGDLNDKNGTVAEMGLKLNGLEPIERMVICRWPEGHGGPEAKWEWPFQAMNDPPGKEPDSCVALYWGRQSVAPGGKRTMGYTYGLGRTADSTGEGPVPMRLLAGGSSRVGKVFTVTCYIRGAGAGQEVDLKLPAGMTLAPGQLATQKIAVQPGKDYAQVSWRVQADKIGNFTVAATWSGRVARQEIHVRESSMFD